MDRGSFCLTENELPLLFTSLAVVWEEIAISLVTDLTGLFVLTEHTALENLRTFLALLVLRVEI